MRIFKNLLFILIFLNISNVSLSATCTAVANGSWSNPAIWSCGTVPDCGDMIVIPYGRVVTMNSHVNLEGCGQSTYIQVSGTLQFAGGSKISLKCGSTVEIMSGGSMLHGGGGGQSNILEICGNVVWKAQDGNILGYILYGAPSPLPVEFLEFSVIRNNENFDCTWSVASERDNDYFSVDYSLDGTNWNQFVQVPSIGDHSDGFVYKRSESMENLKSSVIYFRLTQSDKNGEFKVLDVKSFENKLKTFSVYPNPAKMDEGLSMTISSNYSQASNVNFFNSQGQLVYSENIELISGVNWVTLTPSNLNKGVYFVQVTSNSISENLRIIIE